MSFASSDGFSTPQMIQAERELDGRIDFAFSRAQELRAKVHEVEEKLARDTEPLTNAEVEQFKAYVLGHARTEEWQPVIDRIERGESSWREVVEGVAEGRFDQDVSAALASLSKVPPATVESLVDMGLVADLDKAAQDADSGEKDRGRDDRRRSTARSDDDDEWFEDQSIYVRR